jgi:hypothetical protein
LSFASAQGEQIDDIQANGARLEIGAVEAVALRAYDSGHVSPLPIRHFAAALNQTLASPRGSEW